MSRPLNKPMPSPPNIQIPHPINRHVPRPLNHITIRKQSPKRKERKTSLEENRNLRSQSQVPKPPSPSNPLPTNVSPAKTTQKAGIKATSTDLPPPSHNTQTEKATHYEFLQARNSLKNVTEIQPYADLLKQIPPKDLPLGKIFLTNLRRIKLHYYFSWPEKNFSVEF